MQRDVVGLDEVDRSQVDLVGGKAANLGELTRLADVHVPPGFCVTTGAFRRVLAAAWSIDGHLDRLSRLEPGDLEEIRTVSAQVRATIEATAVPDDLASAITRRLAGFPTNAAWAVRSSATAEDLPTASFAGQHDSHLNVVGATAVVEHVRACWASLFTERAVTYRLTNDIDHRAVRMAVIVQTMVDPQAAGVLFTADPVTSNRRVVSVEATVGLGDALVSGQVRPDVYTVRDGEVVGRTVATKSLGVRASAGGGTRQQAIEPDQQGDPVLTDEQVRRLARLGRRIEAHVGQPQDIEWCLADDVIQVVQSRPITTLFPIPEADDEHPRVYLSVGHQQMMTDAMKTLGLSLWRLTSPAPMVEAGGRLFVDITLGLATQAGRDALLKRAGRSDPLVGDALRTLFDRNDLVQPAPEQDSATPPPVAGPVGASAEDRIATDPAIVTDLVEDWQASETLLRRRIRRLSGPELVAFVSSDIDRLRELLFDPVGAQAVMAGMEATWWLNEQLESWLGERNVADALSQSAPGNVTAEMGRALLDVADVIRPHADVVAFLHDVEDDDFLAGMDHLPGGRESHAAIQSYLDTYGMRCVGEIDVTRPRWSERPTTLVPLILANVANFAPDASARRVEQGLQEARTKEAEVLAALTALPDGTRKAEQAKREIDRLRTFIGYREYPKYGMVRRYFIYKQALLAEADRLVDAGVLDARDDIFHLTLEELHEVVATNRVDRELLRHRRADFRSYQSLTPPRVLTSDGEAIIGSYRRDHLPDDALAGLAVSAGVVEGPARVVADLAEADLRAGDILVTAGTDPSWTPAFVAIAGLVTEVGGLMTHGSVIAREYGLPAVVGVEHATERIRDGQRIRVHGSDGYVQLLA